MTSRAEFVASQGLRAILAALPAGAVIEESPRFREFQSALEVFLGLRSICGFSFHQTTTRWPRSIVG
jgi:hypothetical protein